MCPYDQTDSNLLKYVGNCSSCQSEEFILKHLEYRACINLFEDQIQRSAFISEVENELRIRIIEFEVRLLLDEDEFKFCERLEHDRILVHKLESLWKLKV